MKGTTSMLAAVLLAASSVAAQDLDIHVGADSVTVGERFLVSVTAHHEFAASPRFPEVDTSLTFGDINVLSVRARHSAQVDGGRVDSVVYEVTTFALDTARVGAIPVLFSAGEDTFTVSTAPTWLPVVSLVPEDAGEIRDLAPLVEFPAARWPYVAAAAVLLFLAALLALYLRRRRRTGEAAIEPAEPPIPPDREALQRLDALEAVDLTVHENRQPFYDELSGLLRTYVARRLHVRAMESTTGELVRELQRREQPGAETTARLRNVLVASDYVKFADSAPPPAEGRRLISTSRSIVQDVENSLHPPEESQPTDAPTV